ncbi:MAG: SDR family NAD(P)-dependent oxidoreductase [Planctomycetaceae bacterium]|nr:SDR family NAD(P)-dependent oxidoreductase [Planctomycetaceae bacterium]
MGQQFQPIAIVGMGCRMPGGDGVSEYWKLLVEKRSAIGPVPEERLNRDLYFDSEHGKAGRTYSDLGGIVPERPIDRRVCPISDKLLRESDSAHLTLCEVASSALRDAGIDPSRTPYARTGVYIGHSGGSCLAGDVGYARYAAMAGDILRRDDDFRACSPAERANLARRLVERVRQEMPSEESVRDMKFVASNAAMLIARVHGFEGPTFVVDAACASSLMAMSQAAQALQRGDIDMALAGGASYSKWYGLVLFSMAMSISGSGSRPFDADADGLISSDGYGIVVLKTLDRALADGDRVLAVIRGIGVSSDGRGKSLWAPRPEGQISAIQRAYSSMVDPTSLDYIECHATSTQVGDATELKGLSRAFPPGLAGGRRIPIGSVKANIGHTLEAAGIAGLLKSVLAMQNGVIPPQINFNTPNPEIDWANIPFEVACQPRDWTKSSNGKPRRCAVNSFGIGGLNVHVVLDDGLLPGETGKSRVAVPGNLRSTKSVEAGRVSFEPIAVLGVGTILPGALNKAALWELLVSGKDPKCDLPAGRCWDADVLFAEKQAAGEPVPTTRGGYITDFVYDWKRHKVPPKQIANANPLQFMLLDAADQALSDAGYSKRDYDRSRASVVVGTIFGGDFAISLQLGLRLPHMQKILGDLLRADGLPEDKIEEALLRFEKRLLEKMPALMDETGSFTSSTLASRLSKSFDFMGGAFAIDSDEVSGLAAMHAGVGMLQTGVSDMVLCAAGQQAMDAALFEALQRNGMLSQGNAKSPFDKNFDGVLPAEGVAVVLLKRLADAERDGDPIRAVIRGVGQVSRYEEPEVAFAAAAERTCELAGVQPQSIGVLEASGFEATEWTPPQAELLSKANGNSESDAVRLTGITPQIGYVRGATGMVSVAKAVLELENGKVPPRFGVKSFNTASGVPEAALPNSAEPIYASTPEGHGLIAVNHLSETGMGYSVLLESREKCPQRPVVTTTKPKVASASAAKPGQAHRWAMLFPGQGSHSEGMVARLLERTPSLASKIAEFDRVLTDLGCPTVVALTNNPSAGVLPSQLTMLVMNLLHAAALKARGVRPVLVCGHSYGEYAALVVAGSLTFRDALIATQHRAEVVSQFGVSGGGLMAVASDGDTVRRAIARFPGEVYLANINSPEQTVVGGMVDELREFENSLKAMKIVCKPLSVPAAYHTPLLEAAVGEFRERLKSLPIARPMVPLLSGVGNQLVIDPEVIRENLARQLVTTMDFVDMVHRLEEQGVTLAVECGPKQVLTNLVRKSVGDARLTVLPTDPRDSQGVDPLAGIVTTLAQRGVLTPPASAPNTVLAVTEKASPVSDPSSRILHFDATQRRKDQNRQRAVGSPEPEPAVVPFVTASTPKVEEPVALAAAPTPVASSRGKLPNRAELTAFVTEYIVDQTGYPAEMIELDADLEADLGIDSIKKAQMLGECAQKFELNWLADEVSDLSLDQFPSLGHIIDFLTTERTGAAPAAAPVTASAVAPITEPVAAAPAPVASSRGKLPNRAELQAFVTEYIVDQTGYPAEMIELDADLEADLGIDSIKKAQMLGECAQKFELNWLADEVSDLSLDQFPSLGHIIDFLTTERAGSTPTPVPTVAPAAIPIAEPVVAVAASAPVASSRGQLPSRAELQAFVTDYIVDQTGYPAEMIELDADLEADLGIDSIKKAQMLGECAQKFELNWLADEVSDLSLDQFPSLGHIIDFLTTERIASTPQAPVAPVAAQASQDESTQQAPEVVTSVATLTAEPDEPFAESTSELVTRLVCGGDPYELGLAHGKHQRDAIRRILESQISRYGSRLTNMPELDQALHEPTRYFGELELAELRGIADGAELPLDFLVAHNLGLCEDYVPGCVHFAVTSRANGRNRLIHAANEDSSLALSLADSLRRIVQFRQPSQGYRHVSFSVSGQLAGINGTNEKGLSVSSTLLLDRAPRDVTAQGDIHPVLVKRMLQHAATIPEAIAILRDARRNGAWSVCLSHYPTDSLCYIEYDRDEMIVRENLTRLIGTNHALLLKPTHPTPPHSVHRLERLQDLLKKYENDGISSQSAEVLLRDQFDGRRQRITAHPTMNTIRRVDNQISVVMRPEVSQVRITPGPTPREVADQYSTIPLSSFFQGKTDGGATGATPATNRATTVSVSPQREAANPLKGLPPVADRVMRRVILRPLPTAGEKVTGDDQSANRFTITGRTLVHGQGQIAEELIVALRKDGIEVEHLNWNGDLAATENAFNALTTGAPIQHLFVVAPRSSQELPASDHAERFVPVFRLLQLWAQHVAASGLADRATMTALTFMGGDFGLSGSPVGADGGSHTGFWKALRREFGGLPARVVDFPVDEQPHRVMAQLRAELNQPFELCEVAYSRGQRFRLAGLPVPASADIAQGPTAGSAWVITGGARGVTAVVARELGLRFGVHLHLVGSSPLPEFDPAWTTASADELKTIRRTVMAEARERGEVPLEAWNRIERGLEVEKTLRTMRQAGMKVTYHSCDVASRRSVEETMSAIRALGAPIEGVIHGAGVEAACRFDRKQAGMVRKTFAVKVDGARHLADVLEHDPVRYFVGFGSTSGRFGGLGQADYSAASDALAKFCNDLGRRRPDCRTIAVHWPPWDEVGMAARPESKLALAAGGMGFMPPLEGAAFLLEELLATNPEPEILIIDKPDGLDLDKTLPDRAVWDDFVAAQDRTNQSPLLDTIVDYVAGERAWVEARLDPSADPFLYDHQHRDAPILPMAFGMELLAETLGVLRPDLAGITMSHIEVVNGLRFFSGHPERVTARVRREGNRYIGELVAPFRNRKGVLLENNRLLVRAELAPAANRTPSEKVKELGTPRQAVDYADTWQQIGEPKYGSVYTGPSIRGLIDISRKESRFEGTIEPPSSGGFSGQRTGSRWRLAPAVLDACYIACDRWASLTLGRLHLPQQLRELTVYRPTADSDSCVVTGEAVEQADQHLVFNFGLRTRSGEPLLDVQGFKIVSAAGTQAVPAATSVATEPAAVIESARHESESLPQMVFPVEACTRQADRWEAELRIEPRTEPLLAEHRFNDRPLLPAVAMIEIFSEALRAVIPGTTVPRIRDFVIRHSLHFQAALPRRVQVVAVKADSGWDAKLIDVDGGEVVLATARLDRIERARAELLTMDAPTAKFGPMNYPDGGAPMYHGGPFRCLTELCLRRTAGWGHIAPTPIETLLAPNAQADLVTHPGVLDACFVAGGVDAWIYNDGRVELPLAFDELLVLRTELPRPGEALTVRLWPGDSDETGSTCDLLLCDSSGSPIYQVRSYRSVVKGEVKR